MQSLRFVLIFLVLFIWIKIVRAQSKGEACIDVNNLRGTCNIINTCPHVIELKIGGKPYVRCGFEVDKEIVCCAQRNLTKERGNIITSKRKFMKVCEQFKTQTSDLDIIVTKLYANSNPDRQTSSKCADHSLPLVVGGENANPKEFPHMAILGCKGKDKKYQWTCGGTLIGVNLVMTAAHCLDSSTICNEIDVVRLGDLNIETTSDDARAIDFDVESTLLHPQYNRTLKYNDIGLVILSKNVEISDYIRPACLPYEDYNNESQLIITGWGSNATGGLKVAHLQKANVEMFEYNECNEVFVEDEDTALPAGVKERTQICAGSKQSSKDTCQGDSGGPLQVVHPLFPCLYSIIGITSYGQACGIPGVPAIYTRVYNYNDWIESVM